MNGRGKIMKSTKGVKSGVPERVSISCPTCGTRDMMKYIHPMRYESWYEDWEALFDPSNVIKGAHHLILYVEGIRGGRDK